MTRLNKKILCFVDEYGTAGNQGFALGCAILWAHECGKADKAFSDLLPASVNEVHAANWSKPQLQGIMSRFAQTEMPSSIRMLNKASDVFVGERPEIYARALVETVKVAVKRFRGGNQVGQQINNVEIIIDINEQNSHPRFAEMIARARENDGLFKSVTRVVAIDSAVSRMLQLADVVAHSRAWINNGEVNAKGLREAYKIEVL
ncbi:DUF3800 domain-containing protein [Agrobacterium tumefaciens]|uniref:DUF3800 domain-containing protein n=1 Tax=Agrobacterium tumefaciens TaxID=358 RepID=UPI0015725E92|nr:DUF3800 domain-containing protein [Agrobacterium tumefaciens]NSZ39788.1 DUF3800 domain-containing protein [Agrobacterium tumefaciens]NTB26746.1 DUF3800 domain-containing protein [Agrobacterium tumefaciens]NTB31860.1 DUF3800 domain-containing protein [Agrobacterium tumefaciens]NTB34305.1 DUF3800 domain-containing protein [Agrobacterium tumefaciens]